MTKKRQPLDPTPDQPQRSVCATLACAVGLIAIFAATAAIEAQSLRGSIDKQNRQARLHNYTFLSTPKQVRDFVNQGYLVPLYGNRDYEVKKDVSFPYARPEVKMFVERLGKQYRAGCGEKLVVTSLTRPKTRQPRNASRRSVHPTGMALDLRRSWSFRCRSWLENTLLSLESKGVLDAARENYPPHYHVAVFPKPYARYVERLASGAIPAEDSYKHHEVRRGDTLWKIARRYRTTVDSVKAANSLRSTRIHPGQVLRVPSGS